jgi:hypothetical protein
MAFCFRTGHLLNSFSPEPGIDRHRRTGVPTGARNRLT